MMNRITLIIALLTLSIIIFNCNNNEQEKNDTPKVKVRYFEDIEITGKVYSRDKINVDANESIGQIIEAEFINEIPSEEDRRILVKNNSDFYKVVFARDNRTGDYNRILGFEYHIGKEIVSSADYSWKRISSNYKLMKIEYFDNRDSLYAYWDIRYDKDLRLISSEPYPENITSIPYPIPIL